MIATIPFGRTGHDSTRIIFGAAAFSSVTQDVADDAMQLCAVLGSLDGNDPHPAAPLTVDWGDGVLYDRARVWQEQQTMVEKGMLRPELALAWYYDLPHETEAELEEIRRRYLPKGENLNGTDES